MTLAMAAFATADSMVKLAAKTLPTGQILTVLGAGGAMIFALLLRSQGRPLFTSLWRHPGIMARNLSEIVGTIGIITALSLIPLSQLSAVMQAAPLIVTLGAAVFLGEAVGWRRWGVIVVGLIGVLIIVAPSPGDPLTFGTLMAVVGMLALSCRDLSTRFAPKGAHTAEIAFLSMVASVFAGLMMTAYEQVPWPTPNLREALILLFMVTSGGLAYFCVTAAMRLGDVSAVAPFRYTRIIFAFTLAVVIFGEVLTPRMLLGTALIVAAGLYTLLRERKLAQIRAQTSRPETNV